MSVDLLAPTNENAAIYNAEISKARSLGYNLRYTTEVGFGYEFGIYLTKIKMPQQNSALIHDDGSAFTQGPGGDDIVVESPAAHMKSIDVYVGALCNFEKGAQSYTPYVGIGYAKVKGDLYKSYYSGVPSDPAYGTKGKTSIDGHYISLKAGVHFKAHYTLELEHAKHKLHADAFRSFNINGSDTEFSRTSLNFIYNF